MIPLMNERVGTNQQVNIIFSGLNKGEMIESGELTHKKNGETDD